MKSAAASLLVIVAFAGLAGLARADADSYCKAFARDEADRLIRAGDLVTGTIFGATKPDWQRRYAAVLAECAANYGSQPAGREPAKPTKVAAAATAVPLTPGSEAWKAYCARKYVSFNPETGLYTAMSGKQRPCVVPRS